MGGIPEVLKQAVKSHTVTLTVLGAKENEPDLKATYVAVEYGTLFVDEFAEGPVCATTVVSMASVNAKSGMHSPVLMLALALGATVAAAGALSKARESS